MPSAELTIWIAGSRPEEIELHGGTLREARRVQAGAQLIVKTSSPATPISVIRKRDGGIESYVLRIDALPFARVFQDVDRLRATGSFPQALALLAPLQQNDDPGVRSRAIGRLARIEAARGLIDESAAQYRAAIDLDRRAGDIQQEALDRCALSFLLAVRAHRYADAEQTVVLEDQLRIGNAQAAAACPHIAGLIAFETGDARSALRFFGDARTRAERLGLSATIEDVLHLEIKLLAQLGRWSDVAPRLAQFHALAVAAEVGCRRLEQQSSAGWYGLLLARGTHSALQQWIEPSLAEAIAGFNTTCQRPTSVVNARINQAWARLLSGRLDEATEILSTIDSQAVGVRESEILLEARAEMALSSGAPAKGLTSFEQLASNARDASRPSLEWIGLVGQGRALAQLGRNAEAIARLQSAELLLDRIGDKVPLGEGRETYFANSAEGSRLLASLLLESNRPREALDVIRRARARPTLPIQWMRQGPPSDPQAKQHWYEDVTQYRAARTRLDTVLAEKWTAPNSELGELENRRAQEMSALRRSLDARLQDGTPRRALTWTVPAADELLLVYAQLPSAVVGFAQTSTSLAVRRLVLPAVPATNDAWAAALLAPFASEIRAAERLRISTDEVTSSVDIQQLSFEGAPLAARRQVEFTRDLPNLAPASRGATANRALILGDPDGSLPAAKREAQTVASSLQSTGWTVWTLTGSSASSRSTIEARAQEAELLHFAGHATLDGVDGVAGALRLGSNVEVTTSDVLLWDHVPQTVVLSACDAAASRSGHGLDLADAFLIAGAETVIASPRPVPDVSAELLMRTIYQRHPANPKAFRLAYHEAIRELSTADPTGEWWSFRLLTP